MNLTLDKNFTLHLAHEGQPFATASLGLFRGGDMVAERAHILATTSTQISGKMHVENTGDLNFDLTHYPVRGNALFLQLTLSNASATPLTFDRVLAPLLHLTREAFPPTQPLWTMQGAAVYWGQDFAFPLFDPSSRNKGFSRENFLGHLQDGEGGGIPVAYFWNAARGLALMHIDPTPQDWYMPVKSGKEGLTAAFELRRPLTLAPGETFTCLPVVLSAHRGDFFEPLALYRELLAEKGLRAPEPVPANYEPAWCSWGYEFDVTPDEMTGVLPALHDLGIRWLTLDDRWFDAYGDWNPRGKTFPGGVADLRRMNDAIHAAGAFSQIWWYPLCAEDGRGRWDSHRYRVSQLLKTHPDWVILNADGSVARNNRHLAMLCPALPEVQAYTRALTTQFIEDWGFDGHKLDNIYTVPPCYNPAHHHACPEEAIAAMADVYRIIFETTRALRPNSVTQICPCGTPLTHHLLPATDQTVTADPTSSAQIRQRIKFYKALTGPRTAVFADHVELSDGGVDFASEIGPGGVPSTKFIWPDDEAVKARLQEEIWDLPPEKQAAWQKWFHLYNLHRPAKGEYLNLYDLAFDFPEAHAIQKDDRMYYAFFAKTFEGRVELRGLTRDEYRVTDYANEKDLGVIRGASPFLDVAFEGALLLLAEAL
ncbi:MAG: alpha-galactosidase [Anaerolineales bacterium]|nr:alpha-galactosidase [Anaerolineales bacterium]